MGKKVIIGVAIAGALSCAACGVAVLALGAAADDEPAPVTAVAVSGAHPVELVAFWDSGIEKLALFGDGTAKKWIRQYVVPGNGILCAVKADLEGTWAVTGNQLTVELTDGRFWNCEGDQTYDGETLQYTFELASTPQADPLGITLWLQSPTGRSGFNKQCADPGNCPKYTPDPM